MLVKIHMNYLISIFQQSYGSDFTLISKNITKKSECIGLELQFREKLQQE